MKTKFKNHQQEGFIIGSLLVLMLVISVLMLTITSSGILNYQTATKENSRVNAQFAADSGLDQGIYEINLDETWPGTGFTWDGTTWIDAVNEEDNEEELFNDGRIRTTYEVLVTDNGPDEKIIRSTGRTYQPASDTKPQATRIFELTSAAVTSGFSGAGVVSGVGGLFMNNNSKITGGDVVIGGILNMANQSQIGLSTTPEASAVNLVISHYNCPNPPDATFPRLCGSAENGVPITMQNNAKIYANVQANNQPLLPVNSNITNPGLTANSGIAKVDVPNYDRTTHGSWSASGTSSNVAGCPNNNGSRTWSAGLKINGDVDMKNNCTVTIQGDVWITGFWKTGNKGRIVVPESVGTNRPIIMIDGADGFNLENNGRVIPNSLGTGIEVRTFWSTDSCTTAQTPVGLCTEPGGVAKANSQNVTTIDLGNNGEANNTVFVAQWSRVRVSNNGILGAIAGQSIELSNQAVINFTASIPGSDNLVKTWVKRGYLRVFQ